MKLSWPATWVPFNGSLQINLFLFFLFFSFFLVRVITSVYLRIADIEFFLLLNLYVGSEYCLFFFLSFTFPICSIDGGDTLMLSRRVALAGKRKQRRGFQGTVHANIGPGWQTGLKGLGRGVDYQTITSGVFPGFPLVHPRSSGSDASGSGHICWSWVSGGVHMPRGTFCDVSAFPVSFSWSVRSDETSNNNRTFSLVLDEYYVE
ncbi:hypothetical protein LY76DRAFT_156160 [Colletotrichum caudatum]|nr:hypothetical protein LY76DRAFT_156160 [Colletotrichum caudatum]